MDPGIETEWLLAEFKRRKAVNAAYSLRGFSRAVKVAPGRLSEYLAGKRAVTPKMARKIAAQLGTTPPEKLPAPEFRPLEQEVFAAVADWQHYAILSLMETKDFRPGERWIGRRLGISPLEARESLQRLVRLGLAEWKDNTYRPTGKNLTTSQDIADAALRRSHKQSLEQAIEALEEVAVDLRDVSSVTMAIDVRRIPEAKTAIRDFRRRLMQLLERGVASEVYNLNVQLVPVSRKG